MGWWCGDAGGGVITAGTINPCYFNSLAGACLATVVALGAWYQVGLTKALHGQRCGAALGWRPCHALLPQGPWGACVMSGDLALGAFQPHLSPPYCGFSSQPTSLDFDLGAPTRPAALQALPAPATQQGAAGAPARRRGDPRPASLAGAGLFRGHCRSALAAFQ
jgi:hypothetical protein